ncbi:viral A-type inclusion protein [Spirosoma sp. SC4-14]|uniref:viral A-type inclusion protein n=1 Tax=Spirosoma sp. SC4-14 TaxID=3128900 RepID=UPI0030D50A66
MLKPILQLVGIFSLAFLWVACNQSDEETVRQAENDVFAIHDDIMPLIDDVMKMRKVVKARIASLDSAKATGTATLRLDEERDQAQRIVRDLNVADSLMMRWMDQYKNDTIASLSTKDALRYLDQQKEQISDVKTKINNSLSEATTFMAKP